ncbi:hypothetical protein D3C76_1357070 [compost metagenome]
MSTEIAKGAGPLSDDVVLVRDKAVLDNMRIMVERNMEELVASKYLLNKLFIAVTQLILNRINNDIRELHREMRKRQIKILNEEQADNILYFRFTCRGYEDRFGIMREVLRTEISTRLGMYVKAAIG